MNYLLSLALVIASTAAGARTWQSDYPSCDIRQQRKVHDGGKSGMQDHIAVRANILQADISTARKARPIPAETLQRMWARVDRIRKASDPAAGKQDLSAAQRASYDRQLDAVAAQLCR